MEIIRYKADLKTSILNRRMTGDKIGFAPTMGALHEGHLSLMALTRKNADCVVASIFVNPTQFAPHEDFDSYPRTEEQDAKKLKAAGVDILYLPIADDIYDDGYDSWVQTGENAKGLETIFRPTHFAGVLNIVHRLLAAVSPDIAVFGEKDFQQLQVITESVAEQKLPIKIIGAPILRDEYGLALSSRNAYLTPAELTIARQLNIIVRDAAHNRNVDTAKEKVLAAGFDKIDYIEMRWNRILCAAWLGKTRLIDNMALI